MKIPNEVVPFAYELSKKVYEKKISRTDAAKAIAGSNSMNPGSATDYISNFKSMVEGRRFARTLNAFSMEYFLEHIYSDYGLQGLSKALQALIEHIEYYEGIQKTPVTMHKMRQIHSKYSAILPDINKDEVEQKELLAILEKESIDKYKLLEELKQVKETEPEIIELKGKTYKRNNVTIAKIKVLYDSKCQICGKSILKRDGTKYVEAAHIRPKNKKGCETLDNIILLCPNHHKELDLGYSQVENHTKTSVDLVLNGTRHHIRFEPSQNILIANGYVKHTAGGPKMTLVGFIHPVANLIFHEIGEDLTADQKRFLAEKIVINEENEVGFFPSISDKVFYGHIFNRNGVLSNWYYPGEYASKYQCLVRFYDESLKKFVYRIFSPLELELA